MIELVADALFWYVYRDPQLTNARSKLCQEICNVLFLNIHDIMFDEVLGSKQDLWLLCIRQHQLACGHTLLV